MSRLLVFVFVATGLPTKVAAQVSLCSQPVRLDSAMASADVVFYGIVIESRPVKQVLRFDEMYSWMDREVGLRVLRVWRANLGDTVRIRLGRDSDTTRAMQVDKEYLVFGTQFIRMIESRVKEGRKVSVDTHVFKPHDYVYSHPCSGVVSVPASRLPAGGAAP